MSAERLWRLLAAIGILIDEAFDALQKYKQNKYPPSDDG